MANLFKIIAEIELNMLNYCTPWSIGLTDNADKKRKELGNPPLWLQLKADNAKEAII